MVSHVDPFLPQPGVRTDCSRETVSSLPRGQGAVATRMGGVWATSAAGGPGKAPPLDRPARFSK